LKDYLILLRDRLASINPRWLQAGGILGVAVLLLGASAAFGVFGSGYDVDGSYNQLYPAGSATPLPTSTSVTSLLPEARERDHTP
jgi:hypothetical protein